MPDVRGCTCQLFWFELHERIGRAINILWLAEPAIRLILFGAQTSFNSTTTKNRDIRCVRCNNLPHIHTQDGFTVLLSPNVASHICDSVNRISAISGENTEKNVINIFACDGLSYWDGCRTEHMVSYVQNIFGFLFFAHFYAMSICLWDYGWCDCYASYIRPSISPIANNNNDDRSRCVDTLDGITVYIEIYIYLGKVGATEWRGFHCCRHTDDGMKWQKPISIWLSNGFALHFIRPDVNRDKMTNAFSLFTFTPRDGRFFVIDSQIILWIFCVSFASPFPIHPFRFYSVLSPRGISYTFSLCRIWVLFV